MGSRAVREDQPELGCGILLPWRLWANQLPFRDGIERRWRHGDFPPPRSSACCDTAMTFRVKLTSSQRSPRSSEERIPVKMAVMMRGRRRPVATLLLCRAFIFTLTVAAAFFCGHQAAPLPPLRWSILACVPLATLCDEAGKPGVQRIPSAGEKMLSSIQRTINKNL